MATAAPNLDICGVHTEKMRILKAHPRHFHALSALFLLPIALSLFIYLILQSTHSAHEQPIQIKTLALLLIYSLFIFILYLCAIGTITYSTHHGFYRRPLRLVSSIKSLSHTFIPLAATTLVSATIVILIALAFALFVVLVSRGIELFLGYEVIDHNSDYFTGFCTVVLIIFVVVVLYIQVNWSLAGVIVVVESKWGFEPLRRSNYLVRGMRGVSLSIMLLYGVSIAFSVWVTTGSGVVNMGGFRNWWKRWVFIVQVVLGSFFVSMFMLNYMADCVVLYMYCKFLRGELDWEINAEESATTEYVSLPFDDDCYDKVPRLVSVAQS